jgi:hypothetical protein
MQLLKILSFFAENPGLLSPGVNALPCGGDQRCVKRFSAPSFVPSGDYGGQVGGFRQQAKEKLYF